MKSNFHTHHELCQHASGRCKDYAKKAIELGLQELGFSDHIPDDELQPDLRMLSHQFEEYLDDIYKAKQRYANELTIFAGIESEFFYEDAKKYEEIQKKLDYMILGIHYISLTKQKTNRISSFALTKPEEIRMYAQYACDGMESGYFKILAHPDLFLNAYPDFDEHAIDVTHLICKCAEETNTILEYNINGYRRKKRKTKDGEIRPYTRDEFWRIAEKYNIRTILSSDAHSPKHIFDDISKEAEEAYLFLNTKKVVSFKEF